MIAKSYGATALAAALLAMPQMAQALPTKIWVSISGTDTAGCGPATTPCRTFQYAHDNVAPGGEIDVKDPGGYGALTITKSVSVINDGVGAAGMAVTTGNAITIQASGAQVHLRGLSIEGLGSGRDGIYYALGSSGGSLTVVNCVIRHFRKTLDPVFGLSGGSGIDIYATSGNFTFQIIDTLIADNEGSAVTYLPLDGAFFLPAPSSAPLVATGLIDHSRMINNGFGFATSSEVAPTTSNFDLSVYDTVVAQNSDEGFYIKHASPYFTLVGSMNVNLVGVEASNNGKAGLNAIGAAAISVSDSTFFRNQFGILNATTPNSLTSGGGNVLTGNTGGDLSGTAMLSKARI